MYHTMKDNIRQFILKPVVLISSLPSFHACRPPIPFQAVESSSGATILRHDLFTNDVLYVDLAFNMTGLPARLIPYLPLFW